MQKTSNIENLLKPLIGAGVGGGVGLGLYRLLSKDPSLMGSILASTGGAGLGAGASLLPEYVEFLKQRKNEYERLKKEIIKSLKEKDLNSSRPSPLLNTDTPESVSIINYADPPPSPPFKMPALNLEDYPTTFINPTYDGLTGNPTIPQLGRGLPR
jgi:hypothetical protein